MLDIRWEGHSQKSASQNRHKAHQTGAPGNWGWDCGGATARCTQGEHACQAPGCLSCSDPGRHKTQAQPSLCLCGVPENLNLSGLGLGSACNPGPTPWRAAWSLSTVDLESTHARRERGQTQCGRNIANAPYTRQWHLSAVPLLPRSTTEQVNLNKKPPLPPCVKAEIRHWRDQQTEEAKQREPLWKWQVQHIKIPAVNTDYIRRGL